MQKVTMTRRSFVKSATVAGAALALSTRLTGSLVEADQAWAATPTDRKMYVSICHGCIQACPCRVYVEDNIAVKIEGHPLAPTNLGSLCLKGLNQLHTMYSPRRVLYPLKRAGDRGAENAKWERISWDDAIELAASKIADAIEKYGTYSFFASVGGGGAYSFMQAMTIPMAFGSPTVFEPGCAQCYLPRFSIANYMYGGSDQSIADCAVLEPFKGLSPYEAARGVSQDTKVIVLWGAQPSVSQTAQSGRGMAELRAKGCKTIVVDPNMSPDAVKATVWLRVRPATDGALILAWYRYIFEKKLYDEQFVKTWTNLPFVVDPDTHLPLYAREVFPGYQQSTPANTPAYVCFDLNTNALQPLEYGSTSVNPEVFWKGEVNGKQCRTAGQIYKDTAEPYTLQKAAEICWVPEETIEEAIKIYAEAPVAGIANGVPSDMQQIASQVPLGCCGLDMIMGYVNKPGATLTQNPGGMGGPALPGPPPRPTTSFNGFGGMFNMVYGIGYVVGATEEENAARIAAQPPGMMPGGQGALYVMNQLLLDRLGMKNHKGLYQWAHSHIPSVLEAIKTGIPYKPRVWYDMSGNKLAMLGNAGSWYDAFKEVDFCICQYPMLTSFQVETADLVFPLEEWLEATGASEFGQLNYRFPSPGIVHLGETVPNSVPPQKVVNAASKKLNDALAAGRQIVFGATGAVTGAGPATPSQSSTAKDDELQTSKNATVYHGNDPAQFELSFPFGMGLMGGSQEESVIQQTHAASFGAPSYQAFMDDVGTYQEPFGAGYDTPNPLFVTDPKAYWVYGQHLETAADGLPVGFGTESRKCEVYCTLLVKMAKDGHPYCYPRAQEPVDISIGQEIKDQNPSYEYVGTYSPICQHIEPIESPIEGELGYDPEYPLVITSGRVYYFHHGTMRHAAFARELYPVPDVRMHPKTAEKYGLKHMDWVEVTSRRGTITGRVYTHAGMHEGVLWMERFWNPECFDSSQSHKTGGWRECNINVITKNTAPYNEVFGSYTNRGFTVNIKPGKRPEGIWVQPKEFEPFLPTQNNQYVDGLGSALKLEQTPIVKFSDWDPNAAPMGGGL
ncbi:MAG: molybdopterin-dependent oxidoreductase [Coriobacteriales bacterium]|jgi:anaerobic selenocysteine-containing dehydrogenase|nr:molybdopterin-dependent oxidoreductase [Coriobacteriales bacterium]